MAIVAAAAAGCHRGQHAFELDELGIADLSEGLKQGRYTAVQLTRLYLKRIEEIDRRGPQLRSVIEINPDALAIAEAIDQERRAKGPRSPLHGIPMLLKDNIDTGDRMLTSAGSLALASKPAPRDSTVAARLRAAGAVIIGKTNLSEWANIRSSHSTSGWSGRGGQTRNPYVLDRNPSGSSSGSGSAVSANLCAAAIGTETDGSIVSPSSANGIVGLKPTVGLVSRAGIVPISHTQDTAGPMTRTVRDAAIVLSALAGADDRDAATSAANGHIEPDYTRFLDPNGLQGARIGIARQLYGWSEHVDYLMEKVHGTLKSLGAELVDPVEFPSHRKWSGAEMEVLLTELKADIAAYLATRGATAGVRTLEEIIKFNEANKAKEMPYFGQDLFIKAQAKGGLDAKEYVEALALCRKSSREEGIDAVMDKHRLDAIVAPTNPPASRIDWLNGNYGRGGSSTYPAVAGYPHITLPGAFIHGLPIGVSFFGRAWTEGTLIKFAYAFEQASKARKVPRFLPEGTLLAS